MVQNTHLKNYFQVTIQIDAIDISSNEKISFINSSMKNGCIWDSLIVSRNSKH